MTKHFAAAAILATVLLVPSIGAATPSGQQVYHRWQQASAHNTQANPNWQQSGRHHGWQRHEHKKGKKHHHNPTPATGVPELDPNAAGQALALLIGASLLLFQRRRVVLTPSP